MTVISIPKTTLEAYPYLKGSLTLLSVSVIERGGLVEFIPRGDSRELIRVLNENQISYGFQTDEKLPS